MKKLRSKKLDAILEHKIVHWALIWNIFLCHFVKQETDARNDTLVEDGATYRENSI